MVVDNYFPLSLFSITCFTGNGKHSLRFMGPAIWSKLSKDVKNAESIYSFKKKIRKLDLEHIITEGCKNCFLCST